MYKVYPIVETMGYASEQTDAIIDSNEKLEQVFSSGLDQLDSTLQAGLDQAYDSVQSGFERMEYGLDKIAYGIAGLRSDFNWAMSCKRFFFEYSKNFLWTTKLQK